MSGWSNEWEYHSKFPLWTCAQKFGLNGGCSNCNTVWQRTGAIWKSILFDTSYRRWSLLWNRLYIAAPLLRMLPRHSRPRKKKKKAKWRVVIWEIWGGILETELSHVSSAFPSQLTRRMYIKKKKKQKRWESSLPSEGYLRANQDCSLNPSVNETEQNLNRKVRISTQGHFDALGGQKFQSHKHSSSGRLASNDKYSDK